MPTTELGDFLRKRRAAVRPAQVGLPEHGDRRVAGLRREEVAQLAGVSVDYYVRLEQGRERNPSAQVAETLAVALRLDDDGRAHLFRLAGLAPTARAAYGADRVDPALVQLMAAWPATPALVYNRAYDILAANPLGEALFAGLPRNLMLAVFTEPRAREFYADWPTVAANSVAGFRMQLGKAPDHPRVRAVLSELLEGSEEFAELWRRHDARGKSLDLKTLHHPEVGRLTLRVQTFSVRGTDGQELAVYSPEPDSPSADAVALLGMLTTSGNA
ncbi:transcriptional regulator [Paractinoplanes abujensis]|uniref:Transcriptional regulator with XRE-family HTH domain n=1 Tax=Paractinoplanes abujensis TaxID=882441 RepID=A0A7W7G2G9_9ACTN|nr:helix-turn-helix transcriptional regulator [Actinoplanes abujensis]MBB4693772.1 transcriptional regulator with XRE-family HTH domain [Actinoplanes abujensis]GID21571.1 transcriptional regulator [Actinoplanes abujensis]